MPDLPHGFREAAFATSTSESVITLLKLTIPGSVTIRLSDHADDVLVSDISLSGTVRAGEDYLHAIVSVAAAGVSAGALPESTIVINNLDGQYDYLDSEEIEDIEVEVIEVLKSDPSVTIRRFLNFVIAEVSPGAETLTISLGLKAIEEEQFPAHSMSKVRAPGLFRT